MSASDPTPDARALAFVPIEEHDEGARILYIEDDAFVARAVLKRLADAEHEVEIADDGATGLQRLQEAAFDIVLIDYQLPGMHGLDVLRQVLVQDAAPPAVMVSGASDLSTAVEAMKLGAADFVLKDTGGAYLDLLPKVVGRVLEQRRLERAKRAAEAELAHQIQINQGIVDNIDQGISLYDRNLRLIGWNDRYRELFELPSSVVHKGARFEDVIRYNAGHGEYPGEQPEDAVRNRVRRAREPVVHRYDHVRPGGTVIEVRGGPMPDGGFIASYTDVTERRRLEDELRRLATTDPLTGAHNRRHFLDRTQREAARCRRYDHDLCIVMLDADHFKAINDTHGHAAGDRVLRTLAKVCMAQLRETDVFGRFGGEEFIAALPETPLEVAVDAAERLRGVLEATPIPLPDGTAGEIYVTVSIGVSAFIADDTDIQQAINRADEALYAAKEAGRNRVMAG